MWKSRLTTLPPYKPSFVARLSLAARIRRNPAVSAGGARGCPPANLLRGPPRGAPIRRTVVATRRGVAAALDRGPVRVQVRSQGASTHVLPLPTELQRGRCWGDGSGSGGQQTLVSRVRPDSMDLGSWLRILSPAAHSKIRANCPDDNLYP